MKKLIVLTGIFSFLLSGAAYSQWQLIVSAKPDRDIITFRIRNLVNLNHSFIKVYPTVSRVVIGGLASKAQVLF